MFSWRSLAPVARLSSNPSRWPPNALERLYELDSTIDTIGPFRKARELFDSGALGELMFVRARYGHGGRVAYASEWRAKPEISGGGKESIRACI